MSHMGQQLSRESSRSGTTKKKKKHKKKSLNAYLPTLEEVQSCTDLKLNQEGLKDMKCLSSVAKSLAVEMTCETYQFLSREHFEQGQEHHAILDVLKQCGATLILPAHLYPSIPSWEPRRCHLSGSPCQPGASDNATGSQRAPRPRRVTACPLDGAPRTLFVGKPSCLLKWDRFRNLRRRYELNGLIQTESRLFCSAADCVTPPFVGETHQLPQCTKHQSVFSPSTLGPLSHLQVPLKAPTVAPASAHATPSPGTGTADKGPYPGIEKVVVQIQTTLPTIQREQKSPHLRRVEPVNVGTFVGCSRSEKLFDREVRRPVHSDPKTEVVPPGASPAVCESTGSRTRAPQMIRPGLSNRAAGEMSGTAPAASGEGKRD
ncbi:hypothetical protein EYF80_021301 [Liparis tanakae]|uniref:Uncharacterized protein n=1 Tax=Liparis tanakae TaxID=230148 RepID=A0A4Z2HRP6_9TELE|nr:hypothetical protein EYF80_021301 [Liparis tanakae]